MDCTLFRAKTNAKLMADARENWVSAMSILLNRTAQLLASVCTLMSTGYSWSRPSPSSYQKNMQLIPTLQCLQRLALQCPAFIKCTIHRPALSPSPSPFLRAGEGLVTFMIKTVASCCRKNADCTICACDKTSHWQVMRHGLSLTKPWTYKCHVCGQAGDKQNMRMLFAAVSSTVREEYTVHVGLASETNLSCVGEVTYKQVWFTITCTASY